jgi:hypothetical protein
VTLIQSRSIDWSSAIHAVVTDTSASCPPGKLFAYPKDWVRSPRIKNNCFIAAVCDSGQRLQMIAAYGCRLAPEVCCRYSGLVANGALFHDWHVDCLSRLRRSVSEISAQNLRTLEVTYEIARKSVWHPREGACG